MKRLKILSCLVVLQVLLVIPESSLEGETPVSPGALTENREKDSRIHLAARWNCKGQELYKKKEYSAAIECFQKAVNLNPARTIYVINLARAYCKNEKFYEAHKFLIEVMDKFPGKEDRKGLQIDLANVYFLWAENLRKKHDHTNAIKHYEMAYEIDKVHRLKNAAADLNNIGFLYSALGRKQKALQYLEKALPIFRTLGERSDEAAALNNIGRVYFALGQEQKSLEYYEEVLKIMQSVDNKSGIASALNSIGGVYFAYNKKQKALEYYERALPISRAVGNRSVEAATLNTLGLLYFALGKNQKALEYYEKALTISRAVGNRSVEAATLNNIVHLYDATGEMQKTLEYYEEVLKVMRTTGNRSGIGETLNSIGRVYSAHGQNQKALEYYEKAMSIMRSLGDWSKEVAILHNIGREYSNLGQQPKALQYYKRALTISRAVGDRSWEATMLFKIGLLYDIAGEKQKALEYFEKAIPIMQAVGDRSWEAETMNGIGNMYSERGENQKALEYYGKALQIFQTTGDRAGEKAIMHNIGRVYSTLGENQKALEYYEKALQIGRSPRERNNEAKTLNSIGAVYFALGAKQKALRYYKKALAISRKIGSRSGQANSLNNIGLVYFHLGKGKKREALKYYKKALPIYRAVRNRSGETAALNNVGNVYSTLGEKQKAIEYYEKALQISRTIGDRSREVATLSNIGAVYLALGEKQKTLEYFENSLPIWRAIGNRSGEARTLHNLMIFWEDLKKIQLSIFYGKQCVNLYQELRANISGLDKNIQSSYLESKKNTYRKLADILIKEGLLSEAQQVLDMLKQEEYFEFIRRDASSAGTLSAQVDFTNFEKQWLAEYNTVMGNISTIGKEYHLLKTKKTKNEEEKKHMKELGLKLAEANKAFRKYSIKMKEAFDKYEKDKKTGKHETLTLAKKAGALQSTLRYLDETEGGKSAALHYNVYGGRITVILTTPYFQLAKWSEIDEKKLNRMIMRYRMAVQELSKDPQGGVIKKASGTAAHKSLYDAIFKPVDEELKKYGATNLMIYLDGVLRYVPLAALWDGKSYLVQRYRMTIFTTSSLTNIKDKPEEERKILGFGASAGSERFNPLPYVKEEIKSIVKDKEKGYNGLIKGKGFIDSDFTKEAMQDQLEEEAHPLVHISSHFEFIHGDETKSCLLMGDGSEMKLSDLRTEIGFHKVELLVLAACETGVGGGNGQEIDGFGELAQEKGAKSIVATLWKVTDQSTKDLMVKFYRVLKKGNVTSKIEALRLAQLELAGLDDLLDKNNRMVKRKKSKYSHPYYWGPFIMIGNWR